MAIADFASYKDKRDQNNTRILFSKIQITVTGSRLNSYWTALPFGGVAPTTAVVPDRTTQGALHSTSGLQMPSFTNGRIVGIRTEITTTTAATSQPTIMLCDRLSHQGGLSGTTVGAQTTNLPTAAITRGDTTGADVWAALEVYTALGATGTTVSCSYTRPDGTSGRTTPDVAIGATGFNSIGRLIVLPNQLDDKGFRSVESVSLAGTTGTAGNFGVTLFRPLLTWTITTSGPCEWDPIIDNGGICPVIPTDACLFWCIIAGGTPGPTFFTEMLVAED
jgi:hypothetical protein